MPDPSKSITYQLALMPKEAASSELPPAPPISVVSQLYRAPADAKKERPNLGHGLVGMALLPKKELDVQDNTRAANRAIKPRDALGVAGLFATPLNSIVGDCVGSRTNPEALAAGVVDAGLMAGWAYPPTRPIASQIKKATSAINVVPRFYDEDYWKNREACKNYRDWKDVINRNINAKEKELMDLFTPPIPYLDD